MARPTTNTDTRTRLVVVGGFLGAGKTTAIAELAKRLTDSGSTVGVVTNDQGRDLVDTAFLSRYGYAVLEVTGGCFCCNFDELTARLAEFGDRGGPDIVIAEPVGSCTDLVATIFRPLLRDYPDRYALAPLSVMAEPTRTARYLKQVDRALTTEVNFLFESQLTESDLIILSKSDTIESNEQERLVGGLSSAFEGRPVLAVSAETGDGLERWLSHVAADRPQLRSMPVDYEEYAKAEAALGWLNGTATLRSQTAVGPDDVVAALLGGVHDRVCSENGEIAHVKVYALGPLDFARASITDCGGSVVFSKRASNASREISILVNARVQIDPERLESMVDATMSEVASRLGADLEAVRYESFSPAPPRPTHRVSKTT